MGFAQTQHQIGARASQASVEGIGIRILQLIHSLRRGGAERITLEISRGLRERGHSVEVVGLLATDEYPDPRYSEVPRSFLIEPSEYTWPRCIPRLATQLRQRVGRGASAFDAAAIHTPTAALIAAAARLQIPSMWVFHGYGDLTRLPGVKTTLRRWGDRWAYRRLERRAVVVDDAMRPVAARHLACGADEIDVVRNGIDLASFPLASRADDSRPTICMVGTLSEIKRVDHAIRAFTVLRRDVPDAKLVVIGEGPDRARLEGIIAELGLTQAVSLLGRREDVPAQLARAHVFWQLSVSEGLPVSIIEAMATGLPVVGTNVRGIKSVVDHERTGYLVELDSYDDLVSRSARLLSDAPLRQRLGAAARERVVSDFSSARMIDEYESRFRLLAA